MALISPFKGLRYNQAKTGDLTPLVTQPYDKIEQPLQAEYYARHPLNVVRVIRSDEANSDPQTPYSGVKKTFQQWLADGILAEDAEPAVYVYYQEFKSTPPSPPAGESTPPDPPAEAEGKRNNGGGKAIRKGFIASVKLEEKNVRAHEHTLEGPKADRLRLLRSIETNDELIFMLYSDRERETVSVMDEAIKNLKPIMDVTDDFGERHKVWKVTDASAIEKLRSHVRPRELFIADGHHRFETAMNFKRECEGKGLKPLGSQGFDHRMMALFPMEDPGLVIFPTHRLVKNCENFSGDKLLKSLERHFDVSPHSSERELFAMMDSAKKNEHIIGLKAIGTPWNFYGLRLWNEGILDKALPDSMSAASKRLDVTILHSLILEPHLGIDSAKLAAFTHVEYVRSRDEALGAVGKNRIQAAFLLNPTSVEQVVEVSNSGERMPQKSTDFYPKLLAGLVMMRLEMGK